jgi:hypothetical protein
MWIESSREAKEMLVKVEAEIWQANCVKTLFIQLSLVLNLATLHHLYYTYFK